ncbi:efflux RND transporter periplasmic adaptor subunit [Luteimonas abyssi]|uniref:efflux RND transporter periplasmic adaptor subunit n=1 Tax=Luteimonas abyssi TaxID=1247514 RepID=UPI000737C935|nr:efflux RND transporter periplasmic adaptor subunit [Luteimonas abyssi]
MSIETTLRRRLALAAALLAALAAGFGLARLGGDVQDGRADTDERSASANHASAPSEPHDGRENDAEPTEAGDGHDDNVVTLTPRQIEASGIEVIAVGRGGGGETRLSGRIEPAIGARAAVSAAMGGRIERVLVAPGSVVREGQPLAILVSGEAATWRASADAAQAEAEAARLAFQRDQALVAEGVVARQELEASRARSLATDASARAAAAQVRAAGSPDAGGRATITSPVAGIVGSVAVTPGSVVSAGAMVATVTDPAQSEVLFTAPPALAARVAPGMRIEVTGPDGSFAAQVVGTAPDISEASGATLIRAQATAGWRLPPPGSPVAGVVVTSRDVDTLSVPADAVQTVDGRQVVFVAGDAGFRATPVLVGRRAGHRVEILDGLDAAARIAGRNAFLLKAELAKGEAGHDH